MSLIKGRIYRYCGASDLRYISGRDYECVEDGTLIDNRGDKHKPDALLPYFLEIGVSRDKEVPKKHKNTYEFKVSSPDAIDLIEVAEGLTREHPVAIVKRSDGFHSVLVHRSLLERSYDVDDSLRDEFMEAMEPYWSGGYQPYSSGTLKKLMKVLKKLRVAPYKNKGSLVCQVELLKL